MPLAELLDALDATTPQRVRDQVVVHHPLQPFDIRNVIPGKLVPGVPFTFDSTVLTAARASSSERSDQPKFISGPLPAQPHDDVALADLVGFFKDPVKGFFRALEYTLPWDVDGVSDEISVDIDALEQWAVGDRMLTDMLRGMSPDDARQSEWRRGTLPPGQLGWRKAGELREQATVLASTALAHRTADAEAYDVDVDLGAGRRLTGTVSPVFHDHLVSVTYSKLDGKHLLASWIPLLALYAQHPDRDWTAICIGRARRSARPSQRGLGQPRQPAVDLLRDLVAIYDAGRREPLPLPVKTSYAWASARLEGGDPEREASFRWKSGMYPAEDQDPAQVRAWGANAWLSVLKQDLRPGEEVDGETHRLGAYSARLWLPMLRAEVTV